MCGFGGGKAEITNDDGREAVEHSIRDGCGEDGDEEKDGFGIPESDNSLLLVEVLVLDTGLVSRNSLDCNDPLALIKEPGIRGRVGKRKPDDKCPEASNTTKLVTDQYSVLSG